MMLLVDLLHLFAEIFGGLGNSKEKGKDDRWSINSLIKNRICNILTSTFRTSLKNNIFSSEKQVFEYHRLCKTSQKRK